MILSKKMRKNDLSKKWMGHFLDILQDVSLFFTEKVKRTIGKEL